MRHDSIAPVRPTFSKAAQEAALWGCFGLFGIGASILAGGGYLIWRLLAALAS